MDRGLYIAMTGAKHNMLAQSVHSNNLANAATPGFRADFVDALAALDETRAQFQTRAYSVTTTPVTSFAKGSLQETGGNLDVAIDGDGWIAVQSPEGTEAYTRAGRFMTDSFGMLLNERGDQVLGNSGPIVIPQAETIEIGSDGTISIRALGQGPETLVELDRIKLVNPDTSTLQKRPDGLIYSTEATVAVDPSVRVRKGFTEGSNVNTVNELTEVVGLARQFELQVKLMQTFGEMEDASSRLLQVQV